MKNSKPLMLGNLICLGISACIHPTKRIQIDQCYELAREAMLIRAKCPSFSQDHMILDEEALPYSCLDYVVDNLPVGERLHFNEIIYQFQGATGSCWRVFADLPGKQGIGLVEIPSCFPGVRQPAGWVTVVEGVVQANPERFRECAQ